METPKFFIKLLMIKRKNMISRLLVHREEVEDFEKNSNEAIQYFSRLYSTENRERPIIDNLFYHCFSCDGKSLLEVPFSKENVNEAILI